MPEGKKIRVALAGCGGMARGHARALLAEPEVDVAALCDTASSHTAAYQKDIFAPAELEPAVFASYERMLGAVELDGIKSSLDQPLGSLDKCIDCFMDLIS